MDRWRIGVVHRVSKGASRLIGAIGLTGALLGCKGPVSVTLCNAANKPVEFVVAFSRAEPSEGRGRVAPHERTTVTATPGGDGDYTLEVRRDGDVRRYPRFYYTKEGGADEVTVDDELNVTDGCKERRAPK
jgi:hypothetical protein